MILAANGAVFDVIQTGAVRDLVLFHSLLTDRTVFDGIVPALARRRRVTLVSLPGFGASSPAGPRIEDYADRVARLFPALGFPATTDLVAMSFGGFVGIAVAARHGRLFDRLVLVDAAAAFPEPAKGPPRGMAERALREGMSAMVDTALRRMFTGGFIAAHPELVSERAAAVALENAAFYRRASERADKLTRE